MIVHAACKQLEMEHELSLKKKTPLALYTHCSSNVLNLSIAFACKSPSMGNMIDALNSTFLFFDNSPKRQRFLERVLHAHGSASRKERLSGLCKTRWVERHTCYETFLELYVFVSICLQAILSPDEHQDLYAVDGNGMEKQKLRHKGFYSLCSRQISQLDSQQLETL